jgi:hypothetical protein
MENGTNNILGAMTRKELEKAKVTFKTNESVVKMIDGALATMDKQEAEAQAKASFITSIEALSVNLPHPSDIANVYLAWREGDVLDGEPVETEVTQPDGSKVKEMRQASHKVTKWWVEVNKGFSVSRSTSGDGTGKQATTTKRAITVYKRDGLTNTLVGNFPSASKACDYLKLVCVGDSATRVLARNGYITDTYTGTDYTAS